MENEKPTYEAFLLDCPICRQKRTIFIPKEDVYITHAQVDWKCGRCNAEMTSILEDKNGRKSNEDKVRS